MNLKKLNSEQINILKANSCSAEDWSKIEVSADFEAHRVQNVHFEGSIKLGALNAGVKTADGNESRALIRNATLKEVMIGNNVFISDVRYIDSSVIEDGVWLQNIGRIETKGSPDFANGIRINVVNEGGGRELLIFDRLSAQIAYFLVFYRHEKALIENLENLILAHVGSKKEKTSRVSSGACVRDTNIISNVRIGPMAIIDGADLLREGTIVSNESAVTRIGSSVVAQHFIAHSGSTVDSGAQLDHCFVGQGVQIGRQFSAEHSAFFANSEGFHGEACSLFAGPYTVTHHKSSLLIAGYFSFYNAGSGTNQSNHMYKLGPLHQGTLGRGCKTGSFSYLLWPSGIAPFTAVIGKHFSNFDASDLPFSYITEENGRSVLTPAMNLFTVGTRRDSSKWPDRDKRKDPDKLDLIHFELFNPYTVGKIIRGMQILRDLSEKSSKKQEYVSYNGLSIKRLLLKTCLKYYDMILPIFIGDKILEMLEDHGNDLEYCVQKLGKVSELEPEEWIDISGLLMSKDKVSKFIRAIADGRIKKYEEIEMHLNTFWKEYRTESQTWALTLAIQRLDKQAGDISIQDIKNLLQDWASQKIKLNNMILKDAQKEFDQNSKITFGKDGDETQKDEDFQAVRGRYEENSFVKNLIEENNKISEIRDKYDLIS